ncbi:MAG: TolC family protein [Gemmatimonadota bacterium]|nr:TolC family protein [Gemmatimonadota bacterium]
MLAAAPTRASGQQSGTPLTLAEARAAARRASPELRAAREAATAAEARARQAGAFPNPTLAYSHERTSRAGATNAQHLATFEQPLDVLGQRTARRYAAALRAAAASARIDAAQARLDFDVTRAFAHAVAAERRATLARQAADAFTEAQRVSRIRLAAGDVSGYANRRLQLEAARYAVLAAQTALARDSARLALAVLVADSAAVLSGAMLGTAALPLDTRTLDSIGVAPSVDTAKLAEPALAAGGDSLHALALASRAELRAARLERDAAAAEVRLAGRERIPVPVVTAGIKSERTPDADGFRGLVAGVSLPVPLWDRRGGAIAAADADTRRVEAELDALRRQIAREVAEALAARRAVDAQLAALGPRIDADTDAAIGAARVAYAEGEITLVEWLDAVRAYQEVEFLFAALQAESLIRRAALERAVGFPLFED